MVDETKLKLMNVAIIACTKQNSKDKTIRCKLHTKVRDIVPSGRKSREDDLPDRRHTADCWLVIFDRPAVL